jgi:hypothetical protein
MLSWLASHHLAMDAEVRLRYSYSGYIPLSSYHIKVSSNRSEGRDTASRRIQRHGGLGDRLDYRNRWLHCGKRCDCPRSLLHVSKLAQSSDGKLTHQDHSAVST